MGLSYEEFINEHGVVSTPGSKNAYIEYLKNFKKWKKLADTIYRPGAIHNKSTKELVDLYEKAAQMPAEEVAPILNEITPELLKRHTKAFMNEHGILKWDTTHDISGMFKWIGAGNISQRKPDLQAVYNKLTTEYTKLEREMDVAMTDINKTTHNLIYSKLSGTNFEKWVKSMLIKYFGVRSLYDKIYGNLIEYQEGKDEDGKSYKNMKLKSEKEINDMAANGSLSKEEYEFYNMFRSYTEKYAKISGKAREGMRLREGYIPHMNAHLLEAYSNRGMMSAYLSSRGGKTDPNLRSVKLRARNPLSRNGEIITAPLSYFEDAYKKLDGPLNIAGTLKFFALKKRAQRLYAKGQNEDGSAIELDYLTRDTLLDGSWMDRFTSSRSVRATDMPTIDLNHALTSYVKASMWKYGSKENKTDGDFQGFDRLSSLIDGAIRLNHKYGNANTEELTKKVLWDKLMMGQNQTSFLGKEGDKVVDGLNWLTTVMALGFKMSIAYGNILFGKYSNIRAEGGKPWIVGEKRFWGIGNEKNPIAGMKKAQAILKRYNLVDKNSMYDIGWSNKKNAGGIFTDLSLSFMTLSENWIQGAHFLGMLTEEEWSHYDEKGALKPGQRALDEKRITELEYEVRKIHGRGYSAVDQRMIGLYSLGRSAQMFKKWLVTNYNERFGEEMQNIYGKQEIGSMRMFGNVIMATVRGELSHQSLRQYYDSLPQHQKIAFQRALRGIGMTVMISSLLMMMGGDDDSELERNLRKVVKDANLFYNPEKVTKLGKVYPYHTAKYVSKVSSSALGQDEGERHQMQ